jgi:hypothetical protein
MDATQTHPVAPMPALGHGVILRAARRRHLNSDRIGRRRHHSAVAESSGYFRAVSGAGGRGRIHVRARQRRSSPGCRSLPPRARPLGGVRTLAALHRPQQGQRTRATSASVRRSGRVVDEIVDDLHQRLRPTVGDRSACVGGDGDELAVRHQPPLVPVVDLQQRRFDQRLDSRTSRSGTVSPAAGSSTGRRVSTSPIRDPARAHSSCWWLLASSACSSRPGR